MRKNKYMPHPATMFFILTLCIAFLSWIFEIYGVTVLRPDTGEEVQIRSLLSPEGIRWLLRHAVTNFTDFAPLGMAVVAMFGIGVAQHSGFIEACIRKGMGKKPRPTFVVWSIIALGILSNVIGDAGYIILLPVAAILFQSVGLHPVGGMLVAYVSVACGYSTNIFISTLDPTLATITQEAADVAGLSSGGVGPLCNYYFFSVSALLVAFVIYYISRKYLLPALGKYEGENAIKGYKQLSHKENRAYWGAISLGTIYLFLILLATFSPWGILRGVSGGLERSPFIAGSLFLFSLGIGIMGTAYGFASGRYRMNADVIEGLTQPIRLLGSYFVIVFFAAQMFACFEYSQLDEYIALAGGNCLTSLKMGSFEMLVLFILFAALLNLIMVSATAKWAFMSFIFVPALGNLGIAPDVVQCAFRIGDSATNAVTPFMFYMPFVLTYMQQYDKFSTYGLLFKYTWRFSLVILVAWIALFVLWYIIGLPLGL